MCEKVERLKKLFYGQNDTDLSGNDIGQKQGNYSRKTLK